MSHVVFLLNNNLAKLLNHKPPEEKLREQTAAGTRRSASGRSVDRRALWWSGQATVFSLLWSQQVIGCWRSRGAAECVLWARAHTHTHTHAALTELGFTAAPGWDGLQRTWAEEPIIQTGSRNEWWAGTSLFALVLTFRRAFENGGNHWQTYLTFLVEARSPISGEVAVKNAEQS